MVWLAAILSMLVISACAGAANQSTLPLDNEEFSPTKVSARDCSYGGKFLSIESVDAYTVRFVLCASEPAFLQKLALPVFSITDQEALASTGGDSAAISQKPVGSGPYILKKWTPGDSVYLEKNPNYWGIPPRLNSIVFRWAANGQMRYRSVTGHSMDIADQPDPAEYGAIEASSELKLEDRQPLNLIYIGMKSNFPPFNNADFRRAISYGVDRKNVVLDTLPRGSQLAEQVVPSYITPGYSRELVWLKYVTAQSNVLLVSSGYDTNTVLELVYPQDALPGMPNAKLVAQAIQTDLAEIKVNVQIKGMPNNEFKQGVLEGKIPFYLDELDAEYADASSFYNVLFLNPVRFLGDPDGDLQAQVRYASEEPDPQARQRYYDKANRLLVNKSSIIPLAHNGGGLVSRNLVENVRVGPMNENFTEMSSISDNLGFMQQFEPASLWPADEENHDTWRITSLLYDRLVAYSYDSIEIEPSLADSWTASDDLKTWTFSLRYDVKFNDGASMDANDVVASFAALWDAKNPAHKGRTGQFVVFKRLFGNFLNE